MSQTFNDDSAVRVMAEAMHEADGSRSLDEYLALANVAYEALAKSYKSARTVILHKLGIVGIEEINLSDPGVIERLRREAGD